MAAAPGSIAAHVTAGAFIDIGTPSSLAAAGGLTLSGAVLGTLLQPYLRYLLTLEVMVSLASVWFAAVLLWMAFEQRLLIIFFLMLNAGASWLMVVANYHTTVQAVTPSWVRGRVLAVFLLCVFGAMALGSAMWGAVAASIGIRPTLQLAAAGLALGLFGTFRLRLPNADELSRTEQQA